jgi:hypothetical protein
MPARDVIWAPGMTLPWERLPSLSGRLRNGITIPQLVKPGASTQDIANAVWIFLGTLQPDPTWGYQLIDPSDQRAIYSIVERDDIHDVRYDPQGLYHDPMAETALAIFATQLKFLSTEFGSLLPEDTQYEATPNSDPDSWNWGGTTSTRRIYRWRIRVKWKEPRIFVTMEKLMQLQKLVLTGKKLPDGSDEKVWKIFNKGDQNQLYAYLPNQNIWWSGVDVGDWIATHANDIANAIEAVAWAVISVVTLGAGAGAAAGVQTMKLITNIVKDGAIAAATGKPFDFGKMFADIGLAAASFVQVPGISDMLKDIGDWAKKAGENVLKELAKNGLFSSFIATGGGAFTDLAKFGVDTYSKLKGWVDSIQSVTASVSRTTGGVSSIVAEISKASPTIVRDAVSTGLIQLTRETTDITKLQAMIRDLFNGVVQDLNDRLSTLNQEVKMARETLPDHLKPWFDFGFQQKVTWNTAPFYAKAAVQFGGSTREIHAQVSGEIQKVASHVNAQASLVDTIVRYGLMQRYALFEYVRDNNLAARYNK